MPRAEHKPADDVLVRDPCEELWRAVIAQAIWDATRGTGDDRLEAVAWLTAPDGWRARNRDMVAHLAGFTGEYVRMCAVQMLDGQDAVAAVLAFKPHDEADDAGEIGAATPGAPAATVLNVV